jgi:hypothetical protein
MPGTPNGVVVGPAAASLEVATKPPRWPQAARLPMTAVEQGPEGLLTGMLHPAGEPVVHPWVVGAVEAAHLVGARDDVLSVVLTGSVGRRARQRRAGISTTAPASAAAVTHRVPRLRVARRSGAGRGHGGAVRPAAQLPPAGSIHRGGRRDTLAGFGRRDVGHARSAFAVRLGPRSARCTVGAWLRQGVGPRRRSSGPSPRQRRGLACGDAATRRRGRERLGGQGAGHGCP